jgi:hypothetical protein
VEGIFHKPFFILSPLQLGIKYITEKIPESDLAISSGQYWNLKPSSEYQDKSQNASSQSNNIKIRVERTLDSPGRLNSTGGS